MDFKSVVIIMDETQPANPAYVIVQDVNGEITSSGDQVEVIDTLVGGGWGIVGVGNFQIGNGIYQNVLLTGSF